MVRRPLGTLVAILVACGLFSIAESTPADGQGLFRRLQERVQSRRQQSPLSTQPRRSPAASNPGAADAASRNNGTSQSAGTGGATQRLSPVGSPSTQAGAGAPAGTDARFGGSILAGQGGQNSAGGAKAATTSAPSKATPTMGISVVATTEGTPGLRVATIRPGSQADEAGLLTGDVIVAVDGSPTTSVQAVASILKQRSVGQSIDATVRRGKETGTITIPLLDPSAIAANTTQTPSLENTRAEARMAPKQSVDFGASVKQVPGSRGVVVTEVRDGSPAANSGLEPGDRIVSVDGRLMLDGTAFERELSQHAAGDRFSINAVRDKTLNTYDVLLKNEGDDVAQDASAGGAATASDSTEPKSGESSVFGGIGSVLGGLFGGSAEKAGSQSRQDDQGRQKEQSGGVASTKKAGDGDDSMDFGDGEPVRRVGFEQDLPASEEPIRNDPPSLEELTPPAADQVEKTPGSPASEPSQPEAKKSDDAKDEEIQLLREELRRLQQRLEELEANKD